MTFPPGSRFLVRLWSIALATVLVLAALVGMALYASRGSFEEHEALEASNMARVLESDLASLFSETTLALLMLEEAWERHLRGEVDLAAVGFHALRVKAAVPHIDELRVADAAGTFVAGADAAREAPGIAESDFFSRVRATAGQGVRIDGPLASRATGREVIVFAKRLAGPDGSFGGVAMATVAVDRVTRSLVGADIGASGEAVLYGENFRTLARHPALPRGIASREPPNELRKRVATGEIAGSYRHDSLHDGVRRLVTWRRVERYPALLTVVRAPKDYLDLWRQEAAVTVAVAALLAGIALGSAAMVHRAWRRQQEHSRRLLQLSRTDELTGLANRRAFFEVADSERARAVRYGSALAILMLDIDHFKDVNDTHGHSAGDLVLQHLGETCAGVLREVDVLGRIGGEEFAILLPETALEAATEVAERLRAAVEASTVSRPEGVPLRVTISIGVSALEGEENLDTLMSRADTALYQAKHEGRNRVRVLATGLQPA